MLQTAAARWQGASIPEKLEETLQITSKRILRSGGGGGRGRWWGPGGGGEEEEEAGRGRSLAWSCGADLCLSWPLLPPLDSPIN